MTCLHFQSTILPNPRLFRFLKFLADPSNFLCFSKVLEGSKVSPSEGITQTKKFQNPFLSKNITSNDLFTLPEGQRT